MNNDQIDNVKDLLGESIEFLEKTHVKFQEFQNHLEENRIDDRWLLSIDRFMNPVDDVSIVESYYEVLPISWTAQV